MYLSFHKYAHFYIRIYITGCPIYINIYTDIHIYIYQRVSRTYCHRIIQSYIYTHIYMYTYEMQGVVYIYINSLHMSGCPGHTAIEHDM